MESRTALFTVAGFRIDPARNLIVAGEREISVEPKVMDVLCVLASRPGHVFSRDELIDRVWQAKFGADESLTRAISQIRKAFGEEEVVETISKRGYRLKAAVSADMPMAAPPQTKTQRLRLAVAILAVLILAAGAFWYFQAPPQKVAGKVAAPVPQTGVWIGIRPLEADSSQRSFSDALNENLVTNLSRASLIHVTSGTDHAVQYKVQGSVRKLGTLLRVHVQLVDAANSENIWAANFDREAADKAPPQDQFANAIAPDLVYHILGTQKAKLRQRNIFTLAPWELNLLATWVPGSEEVFRSPHTRDAFWPQRRAIALDPKYAMAHATLAEALAYHALFNPPEDTPAAQAQARKEASTALALAPFDPEVLYQIAYYYRLLGDRENALKMLRRVLDLRPDDLMARLDLPFVRDQCRAQSSRAISELRALDAEILPSNPVRHILLAHLADLHLARGEFKEARDSAAGAWAIVNMTWSGMTLAAAQAELGEAGQAREIAAQTKLQWPALDFGQFPGRGLGRWCVGGSENGPARMAFARLGQVEAVAKSVEGHRSSP